MSDNKERKFLCSSCHVAVPESAIRVVPLFNEAANDYVVTYRCAECWLPALEEAKKRIAKAENLAEITLLGAFFERHGVFLHELKRGDPLLVVRPLMLRMMDTMADPKRFSLFIRPVRDHSSRPH
jgi:hypothetical protein